MLTEVFGPQLRNLVLSAFSRDMKLPDPFTPNLRIELLPEISQAPVFLPPADTLLPPPLKCGHHGSLQHPQVIK